MPIFRSAKVRIAVTCGELSGIGPEVVLKSLSKIPPALLKNILLIGDKHFFKTFSKQLKLKLDWNHITCVDLPRFPKKVTRGRFVKSHTIACVDAIDTAVKLALAGEVDAIVTAPIHKAALKMAGYDMPGHTEYLARLSSVKKFQMMLTGGPLRVVVVTRHIALNQVSKSLNRKNIFEAITQTHQELKRSFGIHKPHIAVCGLNPHAGENGYIGLEDKEMIVPAVKKANQVLGNCIKGPLAADSLFVDAYRGFYDAEICMYHDQGLIPLKMISRGAGVNITLGLPFVRTSPDHGTAYDIANQFKADESSMAEAIMTAKNIVLNRARYDHLHSRA